MKIYRFHDWKEPLASFEFIEQEDFLAQKVRDMVENLPPLQREFIWGFYFQGLSYQEIAQELEITCKAAEKLHLRAKKRLKERLAGLKAQDKIGAHA